MNEEEDWSEENIKAILANLVARGELIVDEEGRYCVPELEDYVKNIQNRDNN